MKVIFMGTPVFAVPSLRALIEAGHDVVAVVTQPDRFGGRGMGLRRSPVKEAALAHNIEVLQPERIRQEGFMERLRALAPDVIAVVAYGKILPEALLSIPPKGCINVHASILPKYRGAAPINHAIINGDPLTGVSTMRMDAGMDTGPVFLTEKVNIEYDDTAEDLAKKLSVAGAALLVKTMKLAAEGKVLPVEQDEAEASYAPSLSKEDGKIDWGRGAEEVRNLIRGLYPWPGAYTFWKGRSLKIHSGRVYGVLPGTVAEEGLLPEGAGELPAGTVVFTAPDSIGVKCGEGVFEITELQPENKRRLKAGDFLKGYRMTRGDKLGEQNVSV
jgi:methionyl-tRNA formyltransferase